MPRSLICPGSTGHWWPGQLLRHDWADYTFSSKMFIRFRKCVHSYFQSTLLASFELFQSSNCLHFENLSNPKYDYLGRRRCTIYITKKLFMQMQNSMLIVLFNIKWCDFAYMQIRQSSNHNNAYFNRFLMYQNHSLTF